MRAVLRALDARLAPLGLPLAQAGQTPPDAPLPLLTLAAEDLAPLRTGLLTLTLYAGTRQALLPRAEALEALFPPEGAVLRLGGEAVAQVWPEGLSLRSGRRGEEAELRLAVRPC